MTGKTHVVCSVAAFAAISLPYIKGMDVLGTIINPAVAFVPVALGAWMPDMDIQQSRLGSKLQIFSKHLKHRGFTHTLVIPLILLLVSLTMNNPLTTGIVILFVGWLAWLIYGMKKGLLLASMLLALALLLPNVGSSILFGLMFGWLFHIIEDMFNSKGCPILWPLTSKRQRMPVLNFIKTRHWTEVAFMFVWTGGCLLWVFVRTGGLSKILR